MPYRAVSQTDEEGWGLIRSRRSRAAAALVATALLASPLGGCGRRGGLEPPPDPAVPTAGASVDAAPPQAGLKRPKRLPIKPPSEPFILDPLL